MATMLTISERQRKVALLFPLGIMTLVFSTLIMASRRWDQASTVAWPLAFTPLWFLQGLMLLIVAASLRSKPTPEQEASMDDEFKAAFAESRRITGVLGLSLFLIVVLEVLATLKLQGCLELPWAIVISPWVFLEFFNIAWRASRARSEYDAPSEFNTGSKPEHFSTYVLESIWWGVVRLLTAILVAARAQDVLTGSWILCLIPLTVGALVRIRVAFIRTKAKAARRGDVDSEAANAGNPDANGQQERDSMEDPDMPRPIKVAFICLVLVMAYLIAGKLDGAGYSSMIIFVPIFISTCCLICPCVCAISCMTPEVIQKVFQAGEEQEQTESDLRDPLLQEKT